MQNAFTLIAVPQSIPIYPTCLLIPSDRNGIIQNAIHPSIHFTVDKKYTEYQFYSFEQSSIDPSWYVIGNSRHLKDTNYSLC